MFNDLRKRMSMILASTVRNKYINFYAVRFFFFAAAVLLNLLVYYDLFFDNSFFHLLVENLFGTVCHQQDEKLLSFAGITTIVCSRCSGIYTGFLISTIYSLIAYKKKITGSLKIVYFASLPMLLDVISVQVGLYYYSSTSAFITGFLFGFFLYLFFIENLQHYMGNDIEQI